MLDESDYAVPAPLRDFFDLGQRDTGESEGASVMERQYGSQLIWIEFVRKVNKELFPYLQDPVGTASPKVFEEPHEFEGDRNTDTGGHPLWDLMDAFIQRREHFAWGRGEGGEMRRDYFRTPAWQKRLRDGMVFTGVNAGKYEVMGAAIAERAARQGILFFEPASGDRVALTGIGPGFINHLLPHRYASARPAEAQPAVTQYRQVKARVEDLYDALVKHGDPGSGDFVRTLGEFYWLMTNLQPVVGVSGFLNNFLCPSICRLHELPVPDFSAIRFTGESALTPVIDADAGVDGETRLVVDALTLPMKEFGPDFIAMTALAVARAQCQADAARAVTVRGLGPSPGARHFGASFAARPEVPHASFAGGMTPGR